MAKYKSKYDNPEVRALDGELVIFEEAVQRAVAENPEWLLAKNLDTVNLHPTQEKDSKKELEKLGFEILDENDELFYVVKPPKGWSKLTVGYRTTVRDSKGRIQIDQFFIGGPTERRAHLGIVSPYVHYVLKGMLDTPNIAEAYDSLQSDLKNKLGFDNISLDNLLQKAITNSIYNGLIHEMHQRFMELYGIEFHKKRDEWGEFLRDYFSIAEQGLYSRRFAPEDVPEVIINGLNGEAPYPIEKLKSMGYNRIKGRYDQKLKQAKEYAPIIVDEFLSVVGGNATEQAQHNFLGGKNIAQRNDSISDHIAYETDQQLPSGLRYETLLGIVGFFALRDNKGIIIQRTSPEPDMSFKFKTTPNRYLNMQLQQLDTANALVQSHLGAYLEK